MMRFYRRRSSPGLVALLAVAMQAAAFFALAHVHSHAHSHAPDATRNWVKSAVALECRAVVERPGCTPAIPHEDREDCQLCWSLAAAGVGTVPPDFMQVLITPRDEPMLVPLGDPLAVQAIAFFEARGPPAA